MVISRGISSGGFLVYELVIPGGIITGEVTVQKVYIRVS
jgi:hypothetical protein